MRKEVKKVLDVLTLNPNYETEQAAFGLFNDMVKEGKFEKFYNYVHQSSGDKQACTVAPSLQGHYKNLDKPLHFYSYLHEDYYEWHNFFVCYFDDNTNFVMGDFEGRVVASNKRAYDYFRSVFDIEEWDYGEI